ncbi:alpha/beta hydrolase [Aequorivita sp. SDUM287046]|uniref:Alpha/beta hydrolase n=1 Tax=Aequorivita aurantiaca TaxID=3053356 RepID=A0ABT8DFC3_9FLAO|nr:alpha/beta hydrolase [Aequorivita aurantiaca]MDN3724050.1 alpha/beta hydrolase [Aequorivita aurantiaca]
MILKKIVSIIIFLFTNVLFSQNENVRELAINLENYTYPFKVEFLKVENQQQQLQMAYMDVMPENYNGKNVLLLHGKNFNGAYWQTTINQLTKGGFRVIVPDQIGFGKSSKPEHFQYTFQQLAENTRTLLDSLGIKKIAVLGHSMGGMLATRFALMYPQTTEKLILENPIGLEDWKLKVPYQSVEDWYKGELKKNYVKLKAYQKENYYDGKWKSEYEPWVQLLAGWTINKEYPLIAWNAALTYDMIFTQPVVYEFENITAPTLLIIGTRDRTALGKQYVSKDVQKTMGRYDILGKETKAKIPNSQLVEIPDVGHLPHIESFQAFISPLVQFLKE